MKMQLQMEKYETAGNDFLLCDEPIKTDAGELAQRLCRRHSGAGADGLVLLSPSEKADKAVRCVRPDGTTRGVHLGAVLCTAAFLAESRGNIGTFSLETEAGILPVLTTRTREGYTVTAEAGIASFAPEAVGAVCGEPVIDRITELGNQIRRLTGVAVGAAYAVCFVAEAETTNVDYLGQKICASALFRAGVDAAFAELTDTETLSVRSFERGIGEAYASASAALAAAIAACRCQKSPFHTELTVEMPGGTLRAVCTQDYTGMISAPVSHVYSARIHL